MNCYISLIISHTTDTYLTLVSYVITWISFIHLHEISVANYTPILLLGNILLVCSKQYVDTISFPVLCAAQKYQTCTDTARSGYQFTPWSMEPRRFISCAQRNWCYASVGFKTLDQCAPIIICNSKVLLYCTLYMYSWSFLLPTLYCFCLSLT